MKSLLAILLSFVITEAPALALHGGYSLNSSTSLVGTYAGVLIPTSDTLLVSNATDFGANALGLFTLSIPSTGLGSGSVVIFSGGNTYTGSIQALPNPDPSSSGIVGVLTATFNYNLFVTVAGTNGNTVATESITASVEGSFDAAAASDSSSVGGQGIDLSGTSNVNVSQGFVSGSNGVPILTENIVFSIEGFKQSASASASTTGG